MTGFVDKFFGPTIAGAINGVKDDLVNAVRDELKEQAPNLIAAGERLFDRYGPQIMDQLAKELHTQLEHWMPILMTGLSKTVVETSQRIAIEGVDKLTDLTPSELDDKIVDPVAKVAFEWLGQVFSGALPPKP